MNRLFLILFAICFAIIKINAQCVVSGNCPEAQNTCAVGESDVGDGGFCNDDDGDKKCNAYCQKTYGKEFLRSECSKERPNGKRECICSLKCALGGCYGDPHCWGWDHPGWIGFQSTQPYHLFKPRTPFNTIPNFEIVQSTAMVGAGVSGVNAFDLIVPDWGQILEVSGLSQGTFTVLLNKKPQTVPCRHSNIADHREEFIDVKFTDAAKTYLLVTTSFGLQIAATRNGYDISISIPRHPDLFNNTLGLLGRWNDNPADDNIDAAGNPQPLDFMWSVAFGNSWLLNPSQIPSQEDLDLTKKLHDQHVNTFNKEHWEHLKKMCKENMHHPEIHHCQKSLGHPKHEIDDCVIDLSHIITEVGQHEYLKVMLRKYKHHCPNHQLEYKHHPRPKHILNHKPIQHPKYPNKHMYMNIEEEPKGKSRRPKDSSAECGGDEKKKDDFIKKKIPVKDPHTKIQFEIFCATARNGVVNGGRCFFLGGKKDTWAEGWKQCEQRGGTMAQIHTMGEFLTLTENVNAHTAGDDSGIWIAMYTKPGTTPSAGSFLNMNESYWSTSPTMQNSKLTGGNTWARTRTADWVGQADCLCGIMHNKVWGFGKLANNPCTAAKWKPLCSITNPDQSFTYQPDKCLAEVVVEKSKGKTAQCCAKGCGKLDWCRSFNFKDSTQTCEYFSWSIKDSPKTKSDPDCDLYSYDEY
jgi:hypothetical protein